MPSNRNFSPKGYHRVARKELANLKKITTILAQTDQPIAVTNSYSGGMSFEVSNPSSDLSGVATINVEMSVSGTNWIQATDSSGDDFTYTLAAGETIAEAISGIPQGTKLRLILSGSVTGTLEIATRQ